MLKNLASIPSTDTLERGKCPACDGSGSLRGTGRDCGTSGGVGSILYRPTWTACDDRRLSSFIESGRGLRYAAVAVDKPLEVVRARAAELGLEVRRPA